MKVIGYCWASEQADNDDWQEPEVIRQYLMRHRWSGPIRLESATEAFQDFHLRPTGKYIMSQLRPSDVLVVPDQSYLFSSASQAIAFLRSMNERAVAVHCVDRGMDIARGKTFEAYISILQPLALAEPQFLRERTQIKKRAGRREGRYLGGNVPIGFTVNHRGELEKNADRDVMVKKAVRLRMSGLSLRAVASELQKSGYPISHTGVDKLLQSLGYPAKHREIRR